MGEINSRPGNSLLVEVTWAWKRIRGVTVSGCLESQTQPSASQPLHKAEFTEREPPLASYSLPTLNSLCLSALPCVQGLTLADLGLLALWFQVKFGQ